MIVVRRKVAGRHRHPGRCSLLLRHRSLHRRNACLRGYRFGQHRCARRLLLVGRQRFHVAVHHFRHCPLRLGQPYLLDRGQHLLEPARRHINDSRSDGHRHSGRQQSLAVSLAGLAQPLPGHRPQRHSHPGLLRYQRMGCHQERRVHRQPTLGTRLPRRRLLCQICAGHRPVHPHRRRRQLHRRHRHGGLRNFDLQQPVHPQRCQLVDDRQRQHPHRGRRPHLPSQLHRPAAYLDAGRRLSQRQHQLAGLRCLVTHADHRQRQPLVSHLRSFLQFLPLHVRPQRVQHAGSPRLRAARHLGPGDGRLHHGGGASPTWPGTGCM